METQQPKMFPMALVAAGSAAALAIVILLVLLFNRRKNAEAKLNQQ
jgi:hypothetical protein